MKKSNENWKIYLNRIMNTKKSAYEAPSLEELGSAKEIIKNVFVTGTGDTFPGVSEELASS